MRELHAKYIRALCGLMDPWECVSPAYPFAMAAIGQPTAASVMGAPIYVADSPTLITAASALASWIASPAWLMEHAPGFVGPVRCAMAFQFVDERSIMVTSQIGSSTVQCLVARTSPFSYGETTDVPMPPPDVYLQSVLRATLREFIAEADENLEANLADVFSEASPQDFL